MKKPSVSPSEPEPAMIPVVVEPDASACHPKEVALIRKPAASQGVTHSGRNDDMDEMIGGSTSEGVHDPKKQQSSKDDLISF